MESEAPDFSLQIPRETYLQRLPEIDRTNIVRIAGLFEETVHEQHRRGTLIAVGGSVAKPFPRKDIDVVPIFEQQPEELQEDDFSTLFDYALYDYAVLRRLITDMIKKDPQFSFFAVQSPALDEEFSNPSILKFDGAIAIRGPVGTPIEFIRYPERETFEETQQRRNNPYVLLARV